MPEFDRDRYVVIVALLGMLGVEDAAQIAPERAEAKLTKRLIKQGIPEGVTDEQKALAEEILGGKPAVAAAEAATKTPAETKEPDNTGKQPYRLAGINGEDDRVEMLAPAFAASRNKRRTDGRQWVADPGAALSEEKETSTDQPKETDVKKDKKTPKTPKADKPVKEKKSAPAEKPSTAKTAKAKAAPKAEKKAPAKKETKAKTAKPAKAPKIAKTPGKPRKAQGPRESGGAAKFRDIMADRKSHPKSEVIAEIVKAGVGEPSARAYTVWAKRSTDKTNPAKGGNPFGFVITETKTDDGVKMIRRR